MSDYDLSYDILDSIYQKQLIQHILNDVTLCNISDDTKIMDCPLCEKIFNSEYPNRKISAHLLFKEQKPFSLEVKWNSPIGFVDTRLANYRIWFRYQDTCEHK